MCLRLAPQAWLSVTPTFPNATLETTTCSKQNGPVSMACTDGISGTHSISACCAFKAGRRVLPSTASCCGTVCRSSGRGPSQVALGCLFIMNSVAVLASNLEWGRLNSSDDSLAYRSGGHALPPLQLFNQLGHLPNLAFEHLAAILSIRSAALPMVSTALPHPQTPHQTTRRLRQLIHD